MDKPLDKEALESDPATLINEILNELFRLNQEQIAEFMLKQQKLEKQDYMELHFKTAGALMLVALINNLKVYPQLHITLPDDFENKLRILRTLKDHARSVYDAYADFYSQHGKKRS